MGLMSRVRGRSDYVGGSLSKGSRRPSLPKSRPGPNASNWDQFNALPVEEQDAYRDVQGNQQLERGELGKMRTARLPDTLALVAGVLAAVLIWLALGLVGYGHAMISDGIGKQGAYKAEIAKSMQLGVPQYWVHSTRPIGSSSLTKDCFTQANPNGTPVDDACLRKASDVERPQWHVVATDEAFAKAGFDKKSLVAENSLGSWLGTGHASMMRWLLALAGGFLVWGGLRTWGRRKLAAANLMHDVADINPSDGDQHIALVPEIFNRYGVFPDVGAHSSSEPSSLIGHAMLSNSGVNPIKLAKRYEADVLDEAGMVVHRRGEIVRDEEGNAVFTTEKMFDEDFARHLFDTSGVPQRRSLRQIYDPKVIPYNPGGKNRDKSGEQATVAQRINEDWVLPEYEPQRPAGVYFIDEAPVNTMVLAMTRAGKGQTYIEPMIDMWLRERRPNNLVINDPKGELLVKNYVRATVRGFQVVQFNLIEVLKTDIYNPLAMAAEAARRGDQVKVAAYVDAIAEVFFPIEGSQDPMWPTAAANAFRRTAYGMIDYYMEEERQLRKRALLENWDPKVLENKVDSAWGKVTLYNCYQLFVQLSSKKLKDPLTRLNDEVNAGKHGDVENDPTAAEALHELMEQAMEQMPLWNGEKEIDMLTLFFNATDTLPKNQMRTAVSNADKSLRAMGGADKMIASVYGIAITAMAFFTDETISRLTSGALSQNVDLAGLSFPRRFGVRFSPNFVKRLNLVGARVRWDCFADSRFTESLGDKFSHADTFSAEGWAKAALEGIFPGERAYLRLRLESADYGTPIKTFYFRFDKGYRTNLSGRSYIKDPVLGTKIVKDGLFVEMVPNPAREGEFMVGSTEFDEEKLNVDQLTLEQINSGDDDVIKKVPAKARAIISLQANYSEQPKCVFLVTPPHLMRYAKLILILLKQLVDLNFDSSYRTKENQKPLYKTRYMLDELGNLQSEGTGIAGFETMLSIGLGQGQEFTLILQTLQQLRDVYGDSVDKIVQGNAANLVFLKSTDDSMIDTLTKMGGITHRVVRNSKSITQDVEKVAMQTQGAVTYQLQREERPVITANDLAFLPPRNSIVFSAGCPPVWNRNSTILPMSFALFGGAPQDCASSKTIFAPGQKFSLQTIPTLSTAKDFDVRLNQPDFFVMLEKRMRQAHMAPAAEDLYRKAYGYSDFDLALQDPDVVSDEIMDINDVLVSRQLHERAVTAAVMSDAAAASDEVMEVYGDITPPLPPEGAFAPGLDPDAMSTLTDEELLKLNAQQTMAVAEDDTEVIAERDAYQAQLADAQVLRYAQGRVSREMLVQTGSGTPVGQLDGILAQAFESCKREFADDPVFLLLDENTLVLRNSGKVVISARDESMAMAPVAAAATDPQARVHMEEEPDPDSYAALSRYQIHPGFKTALVALPNWGKVADGHFDEEVARLMQYAEDA